ncbi:hypothetical protein GCM10027425_28020 [Alteromonas gracilis]
MTQLDVDRSPSHSLAAVLRIRDFRLLWMGLGLSSFGDWLGLLAITALANRQSGDLGSLFGGASDYQLQNFAIAGVLFLRIVPALVMAPIAGWIADRVPRRFTLIAGDHVRAALFLTMPLVGSLYWIFIATVLIELVSLVWGPAKDATVPNLVPPHRLEAANQISLATTYGSALPAALAFTGLTLMTKTVAWTTGIFSEASPIDLALYFNAISFFVSGIIIQRLSSIPEGPSSDVGESPLRVVWEGWRYVSGTPVIRGLVVGITGAFAAGGVVIGLARTFVEDLGGGDPGYGLMFSAVFAGLGLGMWRGTRLLAGLSRRRLFGLSLIGAGVALVPFSLNQDLTTAMILTVVVGFFAGVAWITGNTMLGLEVPDHIRGRTMALVASLIRLALSVVLALGPLLAGLIGQHRIEVPRSDTVLIYSGAAWTFLLAGFAMIAVGVLAYRQMDDGSGAPLLQDLKHAFTSTTGVYTDNGVFVALEGGEGGGKSTQSALLRECLESEGFDVVLTHQPGGTTVGADIRRIVLSPETGDISRRTEALLFAADKAEHVDHVVRPALERGAVVITDRYVDSSLAYQGARSADPDPELERCLRWATGDLRPHLTVVLDLPPQAGLGRFTERDRMESASIDFHERVRESFLHMASARLERYVVIDATLPREQVADLIRQRLTPLLGQAERR